MCAHCKRKDEPVEQMRQMENKMPNEDRRNESVTWRHLGKEHEGPLERMQAENFTVCFLLYTR